MQSETNMHYCRVVRFNAFIADVRPSCVVRPSNSVTVEYYNKFAPLTLLPHSDPGAGQLGCGSALYHSGDIFVNTKDSAMACRGGAIGSVAVRATWLR